MFAASVRSRLIVGLGLCTLAVASPSWGHPDDTAARVAAAEVQLNLRALDYFVGSWRCMERTAGSRPDNPAAPRTSSLVVARSLDDSWFTFKWAVQTAHPHDFTHGHAYVSYDPGEHHYIEFAFSSASNYSLIVSDGPQGTPLVWAWKGAVTRHGGHTRVLRKFYRPIDSDNFILEIETAENLASEFEAVSSKVCSRQ